MSYLYWSGMERDAEAVRAVIAPALPGLDETFLDYLAAVVAEEEGGPTRPLAEELTPLLLSAGAGGDDEDEAAALATCAQLEKLLRDCFGDADGSGSGAAAADSSEEGPSRLRAPLSLGALANVWDEASQQEQATIEACAPRRSLLGAAAIYSAGVDAGSDDELYSQLARAKAKARAKHDGVPLSRREERCGGQGFGLRAHGGERRPRRIYSVGMERPALSDAELKIQPDGGPSKGAFRLHLRRLD